MKKPVSICITTRAPEGESVLATEGELLRGEGVYRLCYAEQEEGERIETRLTLYPKRAAIKKSGAVSWECELALGERKASFYRVGPMTLSMTVVTKELAVRECAGGLTVRLSYLLELEGEARPMELSIAVKEK